MNLSTQVFTQTRFFKQIFMVKCKLRNEQPKSTTAAESIWAVVYANIKTPSMNLELLLSL